MKGYESVGDEEEDNSDIYKSSMNDEETNNLLYCFGKSVNASLGKSESIYDGQS